jgi:HAMP domain-containing protein
MPALTIGRMAKLYGLHRSTLYEAVEKGRVSTGFDGKGQRTIDLSEMIRVYGEPPGKPESARQHPTPETDTRPTPDTDVWNAMLDELRALRQEVKELRQEMRALPAPERPEKPQEARKPEPAPEQQAEPEKPAQRQTDGTVSFADIEARLAERLGRKV